MRYAKWVLAGLVAVLALGLIVSADAQVVGGKKGEKGAKGAKDAKGAAKGIPPSLKAGIAAGAKMKEEAVEKMLKALGPALADQLRAGREVELPGVGVMRVVRVTDYKDLIDGRPAIVPPRNYVEFVTGATLSEVANAPGTKPAKTVQGYEFKVNPNSDGGIRTGPTRSIGTRAR